MQTDVCIRIINEKMNIKILVRWVFDVPAIIAFGFSFLPLRLIHQNLAPLSIPRTVSGLWSLASGLRHLASGTWPLAPGL